MAEVGAAGGADRVFVTAGGRPRLAECAVLFIDLLGVREMNRGRSAGKHLAAIERAVVRGAYRDFLAPDSRWLSAFFSDTLVLASPASRAGDEQSAIDDLVAQAAWLQLNLIAEGFFVRGALTLGKFHLREGLIFGPSRCIGTS